MVKEVARLQSSSLSLGDVKMFEIPENPDRLTALVLRTNKGVYGWLNACPHDGRRLCQDPAYLLKRKTGLIQCMHHHVAQGGAQVDQGNRVVLPAAEAPPAEQV